MTRAALVLGMLIALTACDNFVPQPKVASYDPETKQLTLPHPCPDWSQSQTRNYKNQLHSNFGCAVNTNAALQLDDPSDLHRGKGYSGPDTGVSTRVIERYRAGEIPEPLEPLQDSGTGQ
jgi:type IV pilus biogenesis protein CpaD/CtpE